MVYTRLTAVILLAFHALFVHAQNQNIHIPSHIKLPNDSLVTQLLMQNLSDFLMAAQGPNEQNKWVLEKEKLETFLLLDEVKGITQHQALKNDNFYRAQLINLVSIAAGQYSAQVAYSGINNGVSDLRAIFELIAHQQDNGFLFSSPLRQNTKHWKVLKSGNTTFYFKQNIDLNKVQSYEALVESFDQKLKSSGKVSHYFCCKNALEINAVSGVLYKSDYNGMRGSTWSTHSGNESMVLTGENNAHFDNFDPHDLWHDRLSLVISRSRVYKPVDEGCAYLYGGSWGLSWKQILSTFMEKVANDPNTDWLTLKEKPLNFGASDEKRLMADYVVNALIVQYLEKDKGFEPVWTLLTCGKWEKGNAAYYQTLEKLTGVTKNQYNDFVWRLIYDAKK